MLGRILNDLKLIESLKYVELIESLKSSNYSASKKQSNTTKYVRNNDQLKNKYLSQPLPRREHLRG